jgi:ribonucleoside-diphosphate reductase beta chain
MLQLLPYKYQWATTFFDKMYANSWHPAEVNLNEDVATWKDSNALSTQEREVFLRSLSFVSNLDTVQTYSLAQAISKQITAPEIQILVIRQLFEETVHVLSYSQIIEFLGLDPDITYGRYRKDEFLKNKLDHICRPINLLLDENFKTGTLQNDQLFLEALVNNILLEGVFFYSSFLMFYALARNNKMLNSARMIGLINRDEATHCGLITLIVNSLVQERPDLWTLEFQSKIIDMVKQATELEVAWGQEIISDGILGVTPEGVEAYVKSLARLRLKGLGLPEVYTAENPYDWIDQYTQINQELGAFFETSVSRYSQETPKFDEASLEW